MLVSYTVEVAGRMDEQTTKGVTTYWPGLLSPPLGPAIWSLIVHSWCESLNGGP